MYRPITASDLTMLRKCEYGGVSQSHWQVLLMALDSHMKETGFGMAPVWGRINVGDFHGACEELAASVRTWGEMYPTRARKFF